MARGKSKQLQNQAKSNAADAKVESTSTSETVRKLEADALSPRSASGVLMMHPLSRDIKMSSVTVSLHGSDLLYETELELNYGSRYGLLGLNGCGKSTLLKVIAYRQLPIPNHIDMYFLEHEVEGTDMTALEAVLGDIEERARVLEAKLEELNMAEAEGDDTNEQQVLDLYDRLDELDPERARASAAKILSGLGFSSEMIHKATKHFSGGWRMRIALARALFVHPMLLLLDEPTNHLDLMACVWLEEYLKKWKGTLLLISHSQDFLNGVCTHTIHLQQRKLKLYGGSYDTYMQTRIELEINQMKQFKWEQGQIAHIKHYIAKYGHGSAKLARQAQSREKVLAKMTAAGLTDKVVADKTITLGFADVQQLPPPVMQFVHVAFGYSRDKILFGGLDFGVDMDSRVALVGPNGIGKSTLLKLMCGVLEPVDGQVKLHNKLRLGFYHQHLAETFDLDKSPLEFLMSKYPESKDPQRMRAAMGQFGITGPAQVQCMRTLSDGLRCRIAFAMIAWEEPHILLLDEPTNHLDMETIDALADAINQWNGGMVLVSHDFRLIDQVAKEIWVVEHNNIHKYDGDIHQYKEDLRLQFLGDDE